MRRTIGLPGLPENKVRAPGLGWIGAAVRGWAPKGVKGVKGVKGGKRGKGVKGGKGGKEVGGGGEASIPQVRFSWLTDAEEVGSGELARDPEVAVSLVAAAVQLLRAGAEPVEAAEKMGAFDDASEDGAMPVPALVEMFGPARRVAECLRDMSEAEVVEAEVVEVAEEVEEEEEEEEEETKKKDSGKKGKKRKSKSEEDEEEEEEEQEEEEDEEEEEEEEERIIVPKDNTPTAEDALTTARTKVDHIKHPLHSLAGTLVVQIASLRQHTEELRKPLELQAGNLKPVAIRMARPMFHEKYSFRKDNDPDRARATTKMLKRAVKRERKGAVRELRKVR